MEEEEKREPFSDFYEIIIRISILKFKFKLVKVYNWYDGR